jgi:hypothetical protein
MTAADFLEFAFSPMGVIGLVIVVSVFYTTWRDL